MRKLILATLIWLLAGPAAAETVRLKLGLAEQSYCILIDNFKDDIESYFDAGEGVSIETYKEQTTQISWLLKHRVKVNDALATHIPKAVIAARCAQNNKAVRPNFIIATVFMTRWRLNRQELRGAFLSGLRVAAQASPVDIMASQTLRVGYANTRKDGAYVHAFYMVYPTDMPFDEQHFTALNDIHSWAVAYTYFAFKDAFEAAGDATRPAITALVPKN